MPKLCILLKLGSGVQILVSKKTAKSGKKMKHYKTFVTDCTSTVPYPTCLQLFDLFWFDAITCLIDQLKVRIGFRVWQWKNEKYIVAVSLSLWSKIFVIFEKEWITFVFTVFVYRNNREIQPGESPYSVVKDSLVLTDSSLDVNILNKKSNVLLGLKLQTLEKNTVRFRINERNPIRPRYEVKDVLIQEPKTIR